MTPVKTAILGLVFAVLQFALASLGWGGFRAFFSHPAFIALAAATLAMLAVAPFSGGNLSSGQQEARENRWVLSVFSAVGLLMAYLPAYTDRVDFWTFGGDAVRWAGVALFCAGGALRIAPVFVLRNRFSGLVAIQPGHRLETRGLYCVVRNPSYLGLLINSAGWGLAFRSGVGLLLAALLLLPLIARMHAEEKLLGAHFGAEYEAYRARTWRLLPGIY